jgi:hypothetical protein
MTTPPCSLSVSQEDGARENRTGRSLSLISIHVRETSHPFKLQFVSVVGFQQLLSCAASLEDTPLHLRQVRHIFISAHAQSTATEPKALTRIRQAQEGVRCSREDPTRCFSLRECRSRPFSNPNILTHLVAQVFHSKCDRT